MKFQVLDNENNVSGEIECSDAVFNIDIRPDIVSRVVLWQLAKRRSGNHSVKGKSDVHGTTRKFVRQKGSGGARHGSKKAAQFRGGGIVFGPVVRDHSYDLPKKIRKLGLKVALSDKAKSGSLVVVNSLNQEGCKTKDFLKRFGNMKSALFIDVDKNENFCRALSNVDKCDFLPQIGTNVYDIVRKEKLVISTGAIKMLESRLV